MSINEKEIDSFIDSFITLVFNKIENNDDKKEITTYILNKIKSKLKFKESDSDLFCVYCGKQLSEENKKHKCFRR